MSLINVNIELPITMRDKGDYVVASCRQLDIHAEGSSIQEAKLHITQALDAFITTCLEMGSLEAVLKDCGFSKITHETHQVPNQDEEYINVPISLLASNHEQTKTYAH